jgi:DNA-binding response OmpR family regulator
VLVVDDDDALRAIVGRLLAREGFEVLEAATGQEALALARRAQPNAVLLDVGLPDLDGLAVCDELRRGPEGGPSVLYVSGSAVTTADRVSGLDTGGDGYLVKPVVPAELVAALRAAMRARAWQAA